MAQTAFLLARGRASILAPTHSEHARAADLAGHNVVEVAEVGQLAESRIAIVVNPNNPDGRIDGRDALLALADRLRRRGGLLLVDEAFMDVGPYGVSVADQTGRGNIVVLRSFGKFYGLAGLRLSVALVSPEIAGRIGAALEKARGLLAQAVLRLKTLLANAGLEIVGGTFLFRLVRTKDAAELFQRLRQEGIIVRRFADHPSWLRFGLPVMRPNGNGLAQRSPRRSDGQDYAGQCAQRRAYCWAASRFPCTSSGRSLAMTPMASSTEISLAPHSLSCSRSQP